MTAGLTAAALMTAGLTVARLRFIAGGDVSQFCSEVVVEWTEMGVRIGHEGEGMADCLCDGAWSGVDCRAGGGSSRNTMGSISTGGLVPWETTAAGDAGACGSTWLSCSATWGPVSEAPTHFSAQWGCCPQVTTQASTWVDRYQYADISGCTLAQPVGAGSSVLCSVASLPGGHTSIASRDSGPLASCNCTEERSSSAWQARGRGQTANAHWPSSGLQQSCTTALGIYWGQWHDDSATRRNRQYKYKEVCCSTRSTLVIFLTMDQVLVGI